MLTRDDTKVRGRLCVKRCGPSHRRVRSASAALKNFVRQPEKTFATVSAMNGLTLTWLLWARMLEEEKQHSIRCVRSSRISVGARRAASRPCVSSSVDVPVLEDSTPTRVGMDRAGIGMPSRYAPAKHFLLRARRSHRLLKNLIAVVWMHRNVAIAVKNDGRDRWPVTWNYPVIGPATLSHGDKRRGKVSGGPTGEAGMYTDCCVQIVVRCSHDNGSGRSGRQSTNVDALWINRIVAHDLASDARDKRRFHFAPLLVGRAKPVPAFRLVGLAALCRIDPKASLFFCDKVHSRTGGEIVRRLGAAV